MLNAVEKGNEKLHDHLGKAIDNENAITNTMAAWTTESIAKTSKILDASHEFSDRLNEVIERNELVYNSILEMAREQQIIKQLVAKPGELKDACDREVNAADVEHEFTIEDRKKSSNTPFHDHMASSDTVTTRGYAQVCICKQYQRTLRRQARFAGFFLSAKEAVSRKHLPDCEYAKYETEHNSKSIGVVYTGLSTVLSRAIAMTVSYTTGAGGFSLSPNITLQLMVDESQSPVFRIMKLLLDCVEICGLKGGLDQYVARRVLEAGVQRISEQYLFKRRSPHEVNSNGESAMHKWTSILDLGSFDSRDSGGEWVLTVKILFENLTRKLLGSGLTSNQCDDYGRAPGTLLLKHGADIVSEWSGITSLLCEELPDPSTYQEFRRVEHFPRLRPRQQGTLAREVLQNMRTSTQIASVLGCGSLSAAILTKNTSLVERILERHPSSLTETNILGQTTFHLAADLPDILKLLMKAGGKVDMDRADDDGEHALDYALQLSARLCSSSNTWEPCSNCACTESVKIFLAQGWRCKLLFLQYFDTQRHKYDFRGQVSFAAKLLLLKSLANDGNILKNLGLRFLSEADIDLYDLRGNSVLDCFAPKVAQLLSENGVNIPASLRARLLQPVTETASGDLLGRSYPKDRTSWSGMSGYLRYSSVYHDIYAFINEPPDRLLQLLYDLGFQDLNYIDNRGFSPLTLFLFKGADYSGRALLWLIEHGAKLEQQFPVSLHLLSTESVQFRKATAAHLVLKPPLGYDGRSGLPTVLLNVDTYGKLVDMAAPLNTLDDCTCGCIEDGCHVFGSMFSGIWDSVTDLKFTAWTCRSPGSTDVAELATRASKLLQDLLPWDMSVWCRITRYGMRYFTFQTLGLRHTCCLYRRQDDLALEEVKEIRDEEWEGLEMLEQLTEQFEDQYKEFQKTEKEGERFTNFLTTHWAVQMEQVLADLELRELTRKELRESEEIGVVWDTSPSPGHAVEPLGSVYEDDYWMRKLDEIAPS